MDWPATVERLLALTGEHDRGRPRARRPRGAGVRGGAAGGTSGRIAALAVRVQAGDLDLEAALAAGPYPAEAAREPLERALAQLRGELDARTRAA